MAALGAIGIYRGSLTAAPSGERSPIFAVRLVPAKPLSVSGVIYDDTGTECARTVRLYDRETGELIGETTSDAGDGTYSIASPDIAEVQRIALDDSAGTLYNDLIDRVIPA